MKRIFKHIKNKFQQLKKPTETTKENIKEIITLSLWILGVYIGINLLPVVNSLLLHLPSGLFVVLLLNLFVIFWFSLKTYFDGLVVKKALKEKNARRLIIYTIYAINHSLFVVFNIYQLLCLTATY
jgi:hypothetical protein